MIRIRKYGGTHVRPWRAFEVRQIEVSRGVQISAPFPGSRVCVHGFLQRRCLLWPPFGMRMLGCLGVLEGARAASERRVRAAPQLRGGALSQQ